MMLPSIFLRCIFLAMLASNANFVAARSPPPSIQPGPGADELKVGDCPAFAKIAIAAQAKLPYKFYPWSGQWLEAMQKLEPTQQVSCIGMLPIDVQYELLLRAAWLDKQTLLAMWQEQGGDLNLVRNERNNLATTAIERFNLPLLKWLKTAGLKPLAADDKLNELTRVGSFEPISRNGVLDTQSVFDWLLGNDYKWPTQAGAARVLMGKIAVEGDLARLQLAVEKFKSFGLLPQIIELDKQLMPPLIFSARSGDAVKLMHGLGINVHAASIDHLTKKVLFPSALFVNSKCDVLRELLDLGVSQAGIEAYGGQSTFLIALDRCLTDLNLLERYLKHGVDFNYAPEGYLLPIHQVARNNLTLKNQSQLRGVLQLFKRYGADINQKNLKSGNLPIHTAIDFNNTKMLATWINESNITAKIMHPNSGQSLLSYAIDADVKLDVIIELGRLGAPIDNENEFLIYQAIKGNAFPKKEIIEQLLLLGASLNRVSQSLPIANLLDKSGGQTILTRLVTHSPFNCGHHTYPGQICRFETRAERLDLIRWFVARGANPDLKGANGKSARELVADMTDAEQRAQYEKALEGK
jgi:ankyrin repeat protein